MKIRELNLNRYGRPLTSGMRLKMEDFTLVWGHNEEGKTLAIEALMKLFYGSAAGRAFDHIDRVDEQPEGYVVLEGEDGEEYKLSGGDGLEELLQINPTECRNIFVIRDGDLSVAHGDEGEDGFLVRVTDRLTGLRTGEIQDLREAVIDLARLKPRGEGYSNRQSDDKLEDRVEDAEELLDDVEQVQEQVRQKGLDSLEERRVELKEELDRLEERMDAQEAARERERYEKAHGALEKVQEARRKIEKLSAFTGEDRQTWRDCSRRAEELRDDIRERKDELEEKEDELDATRGELEEQKETVRELQQRRDAVRDDAEPELKDLKEVQETLARQGGLPSVVRRASWVCAVLLGLSLLAALFGSSVLPGAVALLLTAALVGLGFYWWRCIRRPRAEFEGRLEGVRQVLAENGLEAEGLDDMLEAVAELNRTCERERTRQTELEKDVESLEEAVQELREGTIPDLKDALRETEDTIEELRDRSGVDSLEEYRARLNRKKEARKRADAGRASLESLLGGPEQGEGELRYWKNELSRLEEYRDSAPEVDYDEQRLEELQDERSEVREELDETGARLQEFRETLNDIERRAHEVLPGDTGELICRASADLQKVKERLESFLQEACQTREAGETLVRVLDEMNREEKEQIAALFGPDSRASEHFREASGGAYTGLGFRQDTGSITVTTADGDELGPTDLSGGAYDQLYLSIRLALGEQLLSGEKGFFVLDDPFVRADPKRLNRQMNMLRDLCERGWQVIYFSAKGEVRDALKRDIEAGDVRLEAMPTRIVREEE